MTLEEQNLHQATHAFPEYKELAKYLAVYLAEHNFRVDNVSSNGIIRIREPHWRADIELYFPFENRYIKNDWEIHLVLYPPVGTDCVVLTVTNPNTLDLLIKTLKEWERGSRPTTEDPPGFA